MAQPVQNGRAMRRRGFTLVELMIVVAVIGILAALAIYGMRKYQQAAGAGEATAMLQSMRGAQEAFRAENLMYGGCTAGSPAPAVVSTLTDADLYPRIKSDLVATGSQKVGWGKTPGVSANMHSCFRTLGVRSDGPVRFTFGMLAGAPAAGNVNITLPSGAGVAFTQAPGPIPAPREPWYVLVAYGDRDQDGILSRACTTSLQNDVHVEDDTE